MKRPSIRLLLLLLIFTAAARAGEWDGSAFPQGGSDGTRAWLVLPARMVLEDADLPAPVSAPVTVELRGGRNEYECVQLIIMRATVIEGVLAEITEFTADDGATLPREAWTIRQVAQVPAQIPKRAAPVLETWKVHGGDADDPSATPETYAPSTATHVPDPLLPLGESLKLEAGLTRLWLTLRIPKDAAPGAYRGKVRLMSNEQLLLEVPLSVRVWNHVLPDEPTMLVMGNVWSNRPPGQDPASKPLWDQLRPYYDNLKAHRINATGEIYPAPIWRREAPPPDMAAYDTALKYVLDELGFARFRFPGLTGAASGLWQGINVFESAPTEVVESRWISGAAFSASFPPAPRDEADPSPHWSRVAAREPEDFGGARLAGFSQDAPAWVEYAFEIDSPQSLYVWLQVDARAAEEQRLISIDGQELGRLVGGDFAGNAFGFARLPEPVRLQAGEHVLRVTLEEVRGGSAGAIYGILLTPYQSPDLDLVLRERAALSPRFKDALAYHVRESADLLRRRNWLKKAHAKLKDEPVAAEFGRVVAVYDYVGELLPSIRREISERPVGPLRKSVEVWCPSLSDPQSDPDSWRPALKPMDELWAYHNHLHTIGYPSLSMRIVPWLLGRHGLRGYVFWSLNHWPHDPWTHTGREADFLRGTLLYPDPETGAPIDSVRWELFREGLEDYETLAMLRIAMDAAYAVEETLNTEQRAALESGQKLFDEILPGLIHSARDFTWDPAALESARTQAGEALSGLTLP